MLKRIIFFVSVLLSMTFVITYAAPGWANDDILVVRFTGSGDVDTAFNPPNGFLTYDGGFDDYNRGVAIQSDGKIVVAGESGNGVDSDLLVLRYNADGSLDSGFGAGGVVTYDSGRDDAGMALTIQSDGKIVVAGGSDNGADHDALVLRLNADGSLDSGFGAGGVVTYDSGRGDLGFGVAIQSDGKIVVAGSTYEFPVDSDGLVLRYNADGSPDGGFGWNGVVTRDSGPYTFGWAVAIQSDGKIVVAGETYTGPDSGVELMVLRYNADGSEDNGFGLGGFIVHGLAGDYDLGLAVAIQSDGKIVFAGAGDNGTDDDVLVGRLNTDGSHDAGFGTGQGLIFDGGSGEDDFGFGVAIQSDGKIVVAGDTFSPPPPPPPAGDGGGCFISSF